MRTIRTDTEWEVIELEYVKGKETLREIAFRLNISFDTIKKRAAKWNWAEKRSQTNIEIATKALQETIAQARNENTKDKVAVKVAKNFDAIAEIDWLLQQTKAAINSVEGDRKLPELVAASLKLIVARDKLMPQAIADDSDSWD